MKKDDVSIGDRLKVKTSDVTCSEYRYVPDNEVGAEITVHKIRDDGWMLIDERGREWAVEDVTPIEEDHIRCTATLKPL